MADYYTQAVFQPSIPKALLTDKDMEVLNLFNIDCEDAGDSWYWFSEEMRFAAEDYGGNTFSEDDLYAVFQEAIKRSNGKLSYIYMECSYICNKMRPDGFGGYAVFITADDVEYQSTAGWLQERISEVETGNSHD